MSERQSKRRTEPAARGPKPSQVKIEGDWEQAVEKALRKKRPAEGWPQTTKKKGQEK